MVTFVGTQSTFVDALKELVELDYAAVEAYETAIERLDSIEYKEKLKSFKQMHQNHIREMSALLRDKNEDAPQGPPALKHLLTKGKVILANIVGDNAILRAMKSNEIDTNTAYERMNDRNDIWPEAEDILRRGLADERMHKEWLERTISH